VISTLARGAKWWVIYPPTAHNQLSLRLYYSDPDSLFEDSFPIFQGGILLLQRDDQTVRVPPNCLHFVFTLSSCILCGCEITPPSLFSCRIKSFCATVASSRSSSVEKLHGLLRRFVDELEEALADRPSIVPVLDAWIQEADSIGRCSLRMGRLCWAISKVSGDDLFLVLPLRLVPHVGRLVATLAIMSKLVIWPFYRSRSRSVRGHSMGSVYIPIFLLPVSKLYCYRLFTH